MSEDKVGYLLHLGAPECQRRTQLEEILAGISQAYVCRVQGGRAAATVGDLQFFQTWLQLTALQHREPRDVGFPGGGGGGGLCRAAGSSIIRINILAPEIISLEGIKGAVTVYTDPLFGHLVPPVRVVWARESCPHAVPCLGLGTLALSLGHCKATRLLLGFFNHGGVI